MKPASDNGTRVREQGRLPQTSNKRSNRVLPEAEERQPKKVIPLKDGWNILQRDDYDLARIARY